MLHRLALTAACIATLVAGVALAEQGGLGLWSAALALGKGDPTLAVQRGDKVGDFLHGLAHDFEVDEQTRQTLLDVRETALELDLTKLYNMLPDAGDGKHELFVTGRAHGRKGYALSMGDTPGRSKGAFGDIDGRISLIPTEFDKSSGYITHQDVSLSTSDVTDRIVVSVLADAFREVEAAAATAPEGAPADDMVLAALRHALPQTLGFMEQFVVVDQLGGMSKGGILAIDAKAHIDLDKLSAASYPALARFLKRMRSLVDGELAFTTTDGKRLGSLTAVSEGSVMGVHFLAKDGALVPFTKTNALPSEAIVFEDLLSINVQMRPRGDVRYQGTRLTLDRWVLPIAYRVSSDGARATSRIRTVPNVELAGDSVFTGWIVSAADSAFDLAGHAEALFEGIAHGPSGKGSVVEMSLSRSGSHWALSERADMLLLDNALIRFAMRIAGNYLIPEDEVVDDLVRLQRLLLGHLASDWATAREGLLATASAP